MFLQGHVVLKTFEMLQLNESLIIENIHFVVIQSVDAACSKLMPQIQISFCLGTNNNNSNTVYVYYLICLITKIFNVNTLIIIQSIIYKQHVRHFNCNNIVNAISYIYWNSCIQLKMETMTKGDSYSVKKKRAYQCPPMYVLPFQLQRKRGCLFANPPI